MLIVEKEKTDFGMYNIILTDGNKIFTLAFGGNLDLFWSIRELNCTKQNVPNKVKFYITKENMEIYQLFETLYNDIKECNVYKFDEEQINENKQDERLNNSFKKSDAYNLLFKNSIISWHSDDYSYGEGNVVNIIKGEDLYIIDFELKEKKSIYNNSFGRSSVRFRNSGSMFDPFNQIFMRMFIKFQDYDTEYHQMHIEEYNYQKTK